MEGINETEFNLDDYAVSENDITENQDVFLENEGISGQNTIGNTQADGIFSKIDILQLNNGWNDKNERIIVSIGENSASYKWMHDKSSQIYTTLHKMMGFILIIINTGLSAQTLLPENSEIAAVNILRQVFIYIVTLLSVVQNFLKYEELTSKHNSAVVNFSNLYHKIQQEMSMFRKNRTDATTYVSNILKEYDSLVVNGPDIHWYALSQFKKIFSKSDISIPDIADKIQRIEIISEDPIKTEQTGVKFLQRSKNTNLNVMKDCFKIQGDLTDDDFKNLNYIELQEVKRRLNERDNYELERYKQHIKDNQF
jgi:hypothetical protein